MTESLQPVSPRSLMALEALDGTTREDYALISELWSKHRNQHAADQYLTPVHMMDALEELVVNGYAKRRTIDNGSGVFGWWITSAGQGWLAGVRAGETGSDAVREDVAAEAADANADEPEDVQDGENSGGNWVLTLGPDEKAHYDAVLDHILALRSFTALAVPMLVADDCPDEIRGHIADLYDYLAKTDPS